MAYTNKKKINKVEIGLIMGLIIPVLVISVFYFSKFGHKTVSFFINELIAVDIFTKLISLCVIPNLLLFFIFIWTNRYNSARGVIMATFIYTFIVLIFKFIV